MKKSGFALIEFIVVLGVISILLPAIFTLYFASIQNQQKAQTLIQVKQNGDNALSIIESLDRNNATAIYDSADNITKRCEGSDTAYEFSDGISFTDKLGNIFTFQLDKTDTDTQKIASISSNTSIPLTNDRVTVSALDFSCTRKTQFSSPIVSIAFTISQKVGLTRHEAENTLDWATNIKLRN